MKKILFVLVLLLLTTGGLVVWWNNGIAAVSPQNAKTQIFVVQKGTGIRAIANDLKEQNLIRDPIVFFLLVKRLGFDNKIQAGDFRLSPSMTAGQIAENLTHGTLDIWMTIPEGKRAEEVAEIFKAHLPTVTPSWTTELKTHEGYLFPDTYLIPKDADITSIVALLTTTFEKRYASIPNAPTDLIAKEKVVIIASMVEREAKLAEDRPLVASVILNRLKIDMKLDIDATIQYALGYQDDKKTWWKKGLTKDDLKLNSLYNTYTHAGLPPTPIANPGLSVLQAVVTPAQTDYLYYISDSSGKNHYARTIDEHNANIKKYGL